MLVQISKEDVDTLFRIIDKYDVNDEEIDAIERLTDYDMNREIQENKLTLEQIRKLEKLEELFYTALQTYIKKNIDYGDSFSKSYEEFGIVAPVVRISDKAERLKSLVDKEPEVVVESFKDTLLDLGNYAFMTVLEIDLKNRDFINDDVRDEAVNEAMRALSCDVKDKQHDQANKAKQEAVDSIMQEIYHINGLPTHSGDKKEEYTEGDKLNI